ncbi:MAG: prepilin-type N-terminal cleavage/methylation domain-containing protein [Candidatus Wallbacteria bacterium]|nr:prepilin-type N-terminal cleavage/methylation domain-containing protein [Candidatus Wallbacteria bacterium]
MATLRTFGRLALSGRRSRGPRTAPGGRWLRRAFTFVEVLVALGLSTVVLGAAYYFFATMHGVTTSQTREVSIAMALTEFLEVLQNDLYHAYYVVYEEEREEPVLAMVLLAPEDGRLVRRLVTYRLSRDRSTIERLDAKPPAAADRPRRFELGSKELPGRKDGLTLTADRTRSVLILELGNQVVEVALPVSALAPAGTSAASATEWVPAAELDLWASGAHRAAAAVAEAPASDRGGQETQPDAPEIAGEGQPAQPVETISDVAYTFLAGGDEAPVGTGPRQVRGLGEAGVYRARSNSRLPGADAPVQFLRRGAGPGRPGEPGADWMTLIPVTGSNPPRLVLEVNRPVGASGGVSGVDSKELSALLNLPRGAPVDVADAQGRSVPQAPPVETPTPIAGLRPTAGFDPAPGELPPPAPTLERRRRPSTVARPIQTPGRPITLPLEPAVEPPVPAQPPPSSDPPPAPPPAPPPSSPPPPGDIPY